MKKFVKWFLILVLGGGFIAYTGVQILKLYTKQFSPEKEASFSGGGFDLRVVYSAPFKKGRVIFGGLVPYGQVWRTGANEATVFSCESDLLIKGDTLPAGSYTLWTIPDDEAWTVIFNQGDYLWGINADGSPQHDPERDVLRTEAEVVPQGESIEQFRIYFEEKSDTVRLVLGWDHTLVKVPVQQVR